MIRIYADIVQNHTLPRVFPNFGGQCMYSYTFFICRYQSEKCQTMWIFIVHNILHILYERPIGLDFLLMAFITAK